jgi:NAD(P)-dependent dehydrogenase (short-subunit alcohol dehydrogenase family)
VEITRWPTFEISESISQVGVKIDGSVAVVTGTGSGIGRSIAAGLASAGASVVAGDIDAGSAAETAVMIGGVAAPADAASTDGIAALLDTARGTFGPVNIYLANAGIAGQSGLGDDEAAWERSSPSTCAPISAQPKLLCRNGLSVPVDISPPSPRPPAC